MLKLHLLHRRSAWAPQHGGVCRGCLCAFMWTDMQHYEAISYSQLVPLPKTDAGPLASHFFLFNLALSLAESIFKNATSLRRNGRHLFVALFARVTSSFFFLRKGGNLWEFCALGKEKHAVKQDSGRVSQQDEVVPWLLQHHASTRAI